MAGVTTTGTVTVNAAFLQEIKEVNQELWQLLSVLRHRCQRPIAPGYCRQLIEELAALRDNLALHFALEEAYGYFEDPEYVIPNVGEMAERLRQEHRDLYIGFTRLCERAERMFYDGQLTQLVVWLPPQFEKFDRALRSHERRENELIMDSYGSDLGGGD